MRKTQYNVRLSEKDRERLKDLSAHYDMCAAEVIRQIILDTWRREIECKRGTER